MIPFCLALGGLLPVLGWLVQSLRITARLERCHPDTYDALGRPHLISNNTPSRGVAFRKFVIEGRARELRDQKLVQLCRVGRFLLYTSRVVIAISAVAVVLA